MNSGILLNYGEILISEVKHRSKEALRTWLRLLSCETVIEQKLRSLFRINFSVTLPQFDVLSELERAGQALTMSDLSRELMVSNGNVTGVIDRLEKNGFVSRTRAARDRRIQYIDLTQEGAREFSRMAELHEGWLNGLLAGLSVPDMIKLQKLLLKTRSSAADE